MPNPNRVCSLIGCTAEATHALVLRTWAPAIPKDARTDLNCSEGMVGLQGCIAHGSQMVADYVAELNKPEHYEKLRTYYMDNGIPPPALDAIQVNLVPWEILDRMIAETFGPGPGETTH